MPFKSAEFVSAVFRPRVAFVPVPDMAAWFEGVPEFCCRGLTLAEVDFAEAMAQGNRQRLRQAASLPIQEMPISSALKVEYVAIALVPPIQYDAAFKLSEIYPVEFNQVFLQIAELTGAGQNYVKP